MLELKNLEINVNDKEILKGVSMSFELGKNYLILGKNGSGKSTLAQSIMGNPELEQKSGKLLLDNRDISSLTPNARSREGIFLSFQNIPEIEGIKLGEFLRIIYNGHLKNTGKSEISPFIFKRHIKKYLDELGIPEKFLNRDLNVSFSGGEKRKIEILQMRLLSPKYIFLDEIDSGLDINAMKTIVSLIKKSSSGENSFIIITHQFKILDYINFDRVFVMKDGEIVNEGNMDLAYEIEKNGFN